MNYQNITSGIRPLVKAPINPGGLCWVRFTRWEDILTWPTIEPTTGLCNSSAVLKPGAVWLDLVTPDTDRLFSETQESDAAGDYYKITVSGYLTGNDSGRVLGIGTMSYHKYALLFLDRDGLTRIVGDSDSGADFKNGYNSGDRNNSRKRTIAFTWESKNPLPIYAGAQVQTTGGTYISLDLVQFPVVNSYADMLAVATGNKYLRIKVLHDESKNLESTTYDYWPGFGVDWVAVIKNT